MKKLAVLFLALALMLSSTAFAIEIDIPRNETLTINGMQWGAPSNYNIYNTAGMAWPGSGESELIYETLYMYNLITNTNEPLLADGDIVWEDQYNAVVKIKEAAHWNDGEDLTSADVVWTFESAKLVTTSWMDFWTWVEKVEAVDELTVRFTIKTEPYNAYKLPQFLSSTSIVPKHIWEPIFAAKENNGTEIALLFTDSLDSTFVGVTDAGEYYTVSSGAYKVYYYDSTRIVCVRDDNYWGQDASMWGKLAAPKYFSHAIYSNNATQAAAFGNGEVDVAQGFTESIWVLMENMKDEEGNTLVHTYFDDFPYYLGYGMPGLTFNMSVPGLDDIAVRKALALSVDYEAIAANSFSGYVNDVVPSIINTYVYGDYIDETNEEYMAMRYNTTDLDSGRAEAGTLLDEAGYLDVDGDGFREMPDGSKIEWKVETPDGWSDYNASVEVVCESAKAIGLNLVPYFPESSVVTNDNQYGTFEITFYGSWPGGSVANPWNYIYTNFYTTTPQGEYSNRNFGRYSNPEMDALIDELAATTDKEIMKEIVTEIDMLYLTDLPFVALAYRPQLWHNTYSGYWKGYASNGDGTNTPPLILYQAAGYKELYMIEPTGKE